MVIFERKVGEWTHRFRSRFISTGEGQPARVEQVTEIVPPGPFLQRELSFPLNKAHPASSLHFAPVPFRTRSPRARAVSSPPRAA